MSPASDKPRSQGYGMRDRLVIGGVALLYVITGRLGLLLAHDHVNATLIWAPTGISIAAMVLFGRRVWPGVFLGAAITNALVGSGPIASLGIATGNTLEAVVGATLLVHTTNFDSKFARLRDVIAFLVYGTLVCTLVSATIGVGTLYLTGALQPGDLAGVWLTWWLGDAGGAIVVAPVLLVGIRGRPTWTTMLRSLETWIALVLLISLALLGFSGALAGLSRSLLPALLVFPVLVWVGLRLGPRGAILGSFAVGVIAVLGTASEVGPFISGPNDASLFLVWAYVSTVGGVAMILAAAMAERAEAELARSLAEDERARLSAQVQHTQRLESLGLLAGGIAHDFNNLLVPIRGNAELLKLRDEFAPIEWNAMLEEIEVASVQAASLCRQLLSYAGKNRLERHPVDVATLIDELRPLLRTSTPRVIDLEFVGDAVPNIEGDRGQLGQLLMNLVINASEAIGQRSGWVRVAHSSRIITQDELTQTFLHCDRPAGPYVVLEVSDSGEGMTAQTMERIFDPFFSTKQTGRGLGMASVLGIVVSHGGAIKVRSQVGEGTTFEVLLPIAPAHEASAGQTLTVITSPPRQATVLVADDEDAVRRVTCRMLEAAGYDTLEARDGIEAVELFAAQRGRIDLVLFDVDMPRLNGSDALTRVQALDPQVLAVLVSGFDHGRVVTGTTTAFVQKPYRREALLEVLARSLAQRAA